MKPRHKSSITLLELIICIVLVGMVVLSFFGIQIFSQYHLITSVRRATLQNEASYVLEHMAKHISRAIGNQSAVNTATANQIRVWIDNLNNATGRGRRDTSDYEIAYSRQNYQMRYYANYTCCPDSFETLSQKITGFNRSLTDNYLNITIDACWKPADLASCGSPENPDVNMTTRIKMPSLSLR